MPQIKQYFKDYDCIGWVPTIKGALSLSLSKGESPIFGEVDKYSLFFKYYPGLDARGTNQSSLRENTPNFTSKYYIAASSVQTVIDRKLTSEYQRTYRYIFEGEIGKQNQSDSDGLLKGKLYIVLIKDNHFSVSESRMLRSFDALCEEVQSYNKDFDVKAESMEHLSNKRGQLFILWRQLKENIEQVHDYWTIYNHRIWEAYTQFLEYRNEKGDLTEDGWKCVAKQLNPLFCFEVVMSRDGIVLLRNKSSLECNKLFADVGTADDYTKNIPIHRLFKMAMNYVKYIFHSNYHHNETHDNFLPASNLHPLKNDQGGVNDLTPVFKHQLNSFLTPIATCKRNHFADYPVDCLGILLYAESFVKVFCRNKFISDDEAKLQLEFIEIQKKEVEYMTQVHRSMITTFIAKSSFFGAAAAIGALSVALLRLIEPILGNGYVEKHRSIVTLSVIVICVFVFLAEKLNIEKKQFNLNPPPQKGCLWGNSHLEEQILSMRYQFWIWYKTLCQRWDEYYVTQLLKLFFAISVTSVAVCYIFKYI